METQLKSLIEKYCLNSNLTDNQLDEIIDLALGTKANPKEVEEYIQEKTVERKARIETERKAKEETERKAREERIKQKVEEYSVTARKRAAQLLNDNIITEMVQSMVGQQQKNTRGDSVQKQWMLTHIVRIHLKQQNITVCYGKNMTNS